MLRTAYLLVLAVFLLLFASKLVTDGMFIDGVCYAALANNLSQGIGSFWALKLSDSIYPVFYEHPPLMPGIQSLFFDLLGPGYGTERWYCGIVTLLTMGVMSGIWNSIFKGFMVARWWPLPILIWMLNEDVYLSYTANMLECTMTFFDLCAVWMLLQAFPLRGHTRTWASRTAYMGGTALFIVAAFLTKGPVSLFPLAFFVVSTFGTGIFSWKKMVRRTVILTAITMAGIGAFLLYEPARIALLQYFDQQVLAAIQGKRMENIAPHRLYMLQRFFETHTHFLLLVAIVWYGWVRRKKRILNNGTLKQALFFAGMGLCALLPLMISPKQAPHYIVPALPWFALALGTVLSAVLEPIKAPRSALWPMLAAFVLVGAGIWLVYQQKGKVKKDLAQIQPLFTVIPAQETIGFFEQQESLVINNYFQRYCGINLDRKNTFYHYLVYEKGMTPPEPVIQQYHIIPTLSERFILYKKEQ